VRAPPPEGCVWEEAASVPPTLPQQEALPRRGEARTTKRDLISEVQSQRKLRRGEDGIAEGT
jgi:hypothetical protein